MNKVIQQKTPDILKTEYSWRKWPANGALKAWTKHLNVTSGATSRARQRFLKEMHILRIPSKPYSVDFVRSALGSRNGNGYRESQR